MSNSVGTQFTKADLSNVSDPILEVMLTRRSRFGNVFKSISQEPEFLRKLRDWNSIFDPTEDRFKIIVVHMALKVVRVLEVLRSVTPGTS